MKTIFGLILALSMQAALAADKPIDRRALVTRHNLEWNDLRRQISLGNGEFCFNADATGLQTFGGNTMAHWGWHSFPVVDGVFVHSAEWHDTYTKRAWEHPDPIGVLGMLPPMEGVDRATAHRTVLKVWQTWDKCGIKNYECRIKNGEFESAHGN